MSDTVEARLIEGLNTLRALSTRLRRAPFVTLSTMATVMEYAVSYGTVLYNEGAHDACQELYQHAAQRIIEAAGLSPDALGDRVAEAVEDLREADARARRATDPGAAAWVMRHAFDKIIVTHQITNEHLQWMMNLGETAFARGDYAGSVSALRSAVQLAPDLWGLPDETIVQASHLVYIYHGHALLLCGAWRPAYEAIALGLTLSPQLAKVEFDLRTLGIHYEAFEARLDQLEAGTAASCDPKHARFLRAYLYMYSGRVARAIELMTLALQRDPMDADVQLLLAVGVARQRRD